MQPVESFGLIGRWNREPCPAALGPSVDAESPSNASPAKRRAEPRPATVRRSGIRRSTPQLGAFERRPGDKHQQR